jgi:transcriptional regulator with XRE-family HTH domain
MMAFGQIGKILTARREELGLTQEALGKRIGTTQSGVSALEQGKTVPTFASLYQWARALGVELQIELKVRHRFVLDAEAVTPPRNKTTVEDR